MKNLKELLFVFIIASPDVALIWFLIHDYTMNSPMKFVGYNALIVHALLVFIYIKKTYGIKRSSLK